MDGPSVRGIRVENLGPAQGVFLRGMTAELEQGASSFALDIQNCTGPVWLEDIEVSRLSSGNETMYARDCDSLVLSRVMVPGIQTGVEGFRFVDSTTYVFDSRVKVFGFTVQYSLEVDGGFLGLYGGTFGSLSCEVPLQRCTYRTPMSPPPTCWRARS